MKQGDLVRLIPGGDDEPDRYDGLVGLIFSVRRMGGTIRGRLAEVPIDNLAIAIGL